jgi:transposase
MARPLVSDALWKLIEPLLPVHEPSAKGGRPRVDDRTCLGGILFVLKTGIAWEDLPQEMGCGCGMTCWRRLTEWQAAGVWESLHAACLARLEGAGAIDWSRASLDSARIKAPLGGKKPGRTRPTGPNAAASTRSSWTAGASRSRRRSQARTATI